MALSQLLNLPVTILRRSGGTDDGYGNLVPGEDDVGTVGELQQVRREEAGGAGELSDTEWLLILPPDAEINTGDAISIEGRHYELIGDPWVARNPRTQAISHVECTLRRTAGAEDT